MEHTETQTEILSDFDTSLYLEQASTLKRLLNLIIDTAVFYALILVFGTLMSIFLLYTGQSNLLQDDSDSTNAFFYVLAISIHFFYYTICEAVSGRTFAKLITGTRTVHADGGTRLSFGNAALRTLCRYIPLDAISGLSGSPWHDRISKTTVVLNKR